MAQDFVHLHVHSQYSMLDSALRLESMVGAAKKLSMGALALTDHGNMFGALQFYKACKSAGVKPILGCEVNLCRDHTNQKGRDSQHMVLLAKSQEGYKNLIRLVSLGWVEGLSHNIPRIDFKQLEDNAKGLVGLSACMGGHVAQQVLMHGEQAGREAMANLRDILEPGSFFIELQDHGFIEQKPLNQILVSLARELSLPMVATNDCHYLEKQHARAQMVLQCVAAGVTVQEMQRGHHGSEQLYFKTAEEMIHLFGHLPEAIRGTLEVAEMCAGQCSPEHKPMLPRFPTPDGVSTDDYFRQLAREGLDRRIDHLTSLGKSINRPEYAARLEMECDVICQMGFPGYFLIVQDFINWAKEKGIPVGPGRGSGAGSLVAYSLRITDLDPIGYGLLFERFLNPERVSMPDFDIDFCMDRRDEVIRYVRQKYGDESVGQIATFHLLKSKSVVRDVGRVMGMTPQDAGRIAGMVPEPVQGKNVPIADALKQEKRLETAYNEDAQVKELIDTAMSLENLNRHAGMHAAGVVISDGPLWDHVPVFCPEPGLYVTQFHKDDVEYAGLVKFDFLGLKTLTTIQIATALINKRPDRIDNPFDLDRIAMDDAATYALLQSGESTNVFQLESTGMQGLMKKLKPDSFDDIVALCALYRPGPLGSGMVDDYVESKHGRKKIEYPHPCLEASLKETFGVMVYQEQVMQAAREMAGYSLGGADLLRRAMGKKKPEEMAKQKSLFIEGSEKNGYTKEDAERVFELMNYFSGYGFNKSHSAAYALIAYQCAYLKAHYPVEFLCATMSADKDKIDKVVRTVAEARGMGITVLPPDVNESEIDFSVVYDATGATTAAKRALDKTNGQPLTGKAARARAEASRPRKPGEPVAVGGVLRDPMHPRIRFGLGAVKGCGSAALEAIFEARRGDSTTAVRASGERSEAREGVGPDGLRPAGGEAAHVSPITKAPFTDVFDFAERVDLRRVNKSVIEALTQCGAFDSLHEPMDISRARGFGAIETAVERGKQASADRDSGQTDLFGMLTASSDDGPRIAPRPKFPEGTSWERKELLRREKATLGFYVSGHPLDSFREELRRFCDATTATATDKADGTTVKLGGIVEDLRVRPMRTGGKIGFFQLEDPFGRIEVVVRGKALEAYLDVLQSDGPILMTGIVREDRERGGGDGDGPPQGTGVMRIMLDKAEPLVDAFRARTRSVLVKMRLARLDREKLVALRRTLEDFPGSIPVRLELASDDWRVTLGAKKILVDPSEAMLTQLERMFGEKVCELR